MSETHLTRASERRKETTQTPGMRREEAVRTDAVWAGMAVTTAGTFSGWHHHGAYESVIYVLQGQLRLQYGAGGAKTIEATPGDTLYVAAGEVHREGNPGADDSEIFVVRSGSGDLVINVDGPAER